MSFELESKKESDQEIILFLKQPNVKALLTNLWLEKYDEVLNDNSFEGQIKRRTSEKLVIMLIKALKEQRELEQDILADEKVLDSPTAQWRGDEKTEWAHELASKRTFSRQDIEAKIQSIKIALEELVGIKRDEGPHR